VTNLPGTTSVGKTLGGSVGRTLGGSVGNTLGGIVGAGFDEAVGKVGGAEGAPQAATTVAMSSITSINLILTLILLKEKKRLLLVV